MSEIAAAVGKAADAEVYATRLGANRAAYHRQFYTKAGGAFRYGQGYGDLRISTEHFLISTPNAWY